MSVDPTQLDNPSRIARETLLRLAQRRVAPTPENYRQLYNEIAGISGPSNGSSAERMLRHFAADLPRMAPHLEPTANVLHSAVTAGDWSKCERTFLDLVTDRHSGSSWAATIRDVMRQMDARHQGLATAQKKDMLERVLTNHSTDGARLQTKLQALVNAWAEMPTAIAEAAPDTAATTTTDAPVSSHSGSPTGDDRCADLRELLSKTLHYGLVS